MGEPALTEDGKRASFQVRASDCFLCWRPGVVKVWLLGKMRNLCERHRHVTRAEPAQMARVAPSAIAVDRLPVPGAEGV